MHLHMSQGPSDDMILKTRFSVYYDKPILAFRTRLEFLEVLGGRVLIL